MIKDIDLFENQLNVIGYLLVNEHIKEIDKLSITKDYLLNRKLYPSDDCKLYYPI